MAEFHTVATIDEIPEGEGRCFEINNRSIAVFNVDGRFTAIDDLCPHMGASLSAGHFDKPTCTVACPWHGWRFNVVDGAWADNPRIKTDVFEVRIVKDSIQVSDHPVSSLPANKETDKQQANDTGSRQMGSSNSDNNDVTLGDFQHLIREMYYEKDAARGIAGTFMWLSEEIGELATALRSNDKENLSEEFADVLAWLVTIANVAEVDLTAAISKKYGSGCPGCQQFVCTCSDEGKP